MQVKANEDIGKCGCGRSPTGKCCGYHALNAADWEAKKKELEEAAKNTGTPSE